jgi:hypothetical protein
MPATRLTNTGNLLVNGSFDEVTFNSNSGVKKNTLSSSNAFDNTSYWQQIAATVTPNSTIAPDGTNTAYFLKDSVTANNGHLIQAVPTWTSGNIYTYSIYAKASTKIYLFLLIGAGAIPSQQNATFNLSTGATSGVNTGNGTTAAMVSVGNGWWRCSITTPAATSTGTSTVWASLTNTSQSVNYTGDGVSGIYIWGAQVEIGTSPTIYVPTNSTGVSTSTSSNKTGIDGTVYITNQFDEVTYNISNPVIKNLYHYTEQFDNAYWAKTNGTTISANSTLAPNGTMTADKIQEVATTSFFGLALNPTAIASTVYTYSIYAKAAERNQMYVAFTVVPNCNCTFTLTGSGSVSAGAGVSATITSVGNGWYRCTGTFTTASSGSNLLYHIFVTGTGTVVGVAGNGIYIWGAQLELGSTATIYQGIAAANTLVAPNFAKREGSDGSMYITGTYDEVTGVV